MYIYIYIYIYMYTYAKKNVYISMLMLDEAHERSLATEVQRPSCHV